MRDRGFGYWITVIAGVIALAGILANSSVRLSDAERKTQEIPGVKWDLILVKQMLAAMNPVKYDSVLTNQIRIYGQRPEGKGNP